MQVLFPREVCTASFYSPQFYMDSAKLHTSLVVEFEAGLSCKLHAQAYDVASQSFYTVWSEGGFTNTTRDVIFTDQVVFTPATAVSVMAAPLMRWYIEMSGTGSITMSMAVFELTSERQAA